MARLVGIDLGTTYFVAATPPLFLFRGHQWGEGA